MQRWLAGTALVLGREGGRAGRGPGRVVCLPPASLRGANSARAEGSFTADPGLSSGLTGAKDCRHHTLNKAGLLEQLSQTNCSPSPKIPVKEGKSSVGAGAAASCTRSTLASPQLGYQLISFSFKQHNAFCRQNHMDNFHTAAT